MPLFLFLLAIVLSQFSFWEQGGHKDSELISLLCPMSKLVSSVLTCVRIVLIQHIFVLSQLILWFTWFLDRNVPHENMYSQTAYICAMWKGSYLVYWFWFNKCAEKERLVPSISSPDCWLVSLTRKISLCKDFKVYSHPFERRRCPFLCTFFSLLSTIFFEWSLTWTNI